jgi:hypothetical protein
MTAHLSSRAADRVPAAALLGIVAVVNGAFCATVVHVLRRPRYASAGNLLQLLVAALMLNLFSTGMAAIYRWRYRWHRRFTCCLAAQALLSLMAFALVRAIRYADHDFAIHLFGAVYALLVYSHLACLLVYAFRNVPYVAGRTRPTRSLHVWSFVVSLLIYCAISPWVQYACWPTADEPHYLLLTHSLLFDHDFDLANNYAKGDYKSFYPPNISRPEHHSVVNARGQEVPVHDIGVSALLVAGYAMGGRLGAILELNLVGAILALGIFVLALEFDVGSRAALGAWALFAFTSPIVVYTSQIYPEIVGAGGAVWAMVAHAKFARTQKSSLLLVASSLLAVLPWLSIRYWLIIGPMLTIMVLHLLVRKHASKLFLVADLAVLVMPFAFSFIAFALFDLHWYQTAIPNAGYVLLLRPRASLFTHNLLPGLPGLLFDRAFGLLTTAPVYVLAIAGAGVLCRRRPFQGLLLASPAVAYVLFAAPNRFWYGGWAPPPRYIISGIVLLAPASAVVLHYRVPRLLLSLLAGWSFFIAMSYAAWPLARYTHWTSTQSALSDFLAHSLNFHFDGIFPSFIRAGRSDYFLCLLWLLATVVCVWKFVRNAASYNLEKRSRAIPDSR